MLQVLIIEDSPVNMALTVAILELAGHISVQAETAAQGIEMARVQPFDVILMDIQLPDMDGRAATRVLKADPRLAHIPVIALTALAMPGDQESMISAGCDGYVTKPIRYKEFVAEVEAVVARSRQARPS
jgi:two-component system cell cycle response regulator DivK